MFIALSEGKKKHSMQNAAPCCPTQQPLMLYNWTLVKQKLTNWKRTVPARKSLKIFINCMSPIAPLVLQLSAEQQHNVRKNKLHKCNYVFAKTNLRIVTVDTYNRTVYHFAHVTAVVTRSAIKKIKPSLRGPTWATSFTSNCGDLIVIIIQIISVTADVAFPLSSVDLLCR